MGNGDNNFIGLYALPVSVYYSWDSYFKEEHLLQERGGNEHEILGIFWVYVCPEPQAVNEEVMMFLGGPSPLKNRTNYH